jgi:uncharacterized NAD-dependent epimerase/dehydratase family protein
MKKLTRLALLVEGAKDIFQAKTASLLLRYRTDDIALLVDSTHTSTSPNIFTSSGVPVVKSIKDHAKKVDALVICLVLPKGKIPKSWLNEITIAIKNGVDVINPLHINLGTLPAVVKALGGVNPSSTEAVTLFKKGKGTVYNIRAVPDDLELFSLKVLDTKAKRVLTVGTDCNIGKMLTTLELNKAALKHGLDSSFIATGQIGIMVKGDGIAVDRVISDFLPGAVERLILKEQRRDILFVEGQGSIFQPIYSAVTLGLLHGTAPDAMILCHMPTRKKLRYTDIDIPDLKTAIRVHEELAGMINKSKVIGISLNCHDLTDEQAKKAIADVEKLTGLPATDPVKFGVDKLFDAIKKEFLISDCDC